MTRAAERPSTMNPDQDEPEQNQDEVWQEQVEGDTPDYSTTQALNLAHRVTEKLVEQTIRGAGMLLAQTDLTPARLRAQVTSPGGTTAAAIHVDEGK